MERTRTYTVQKMADAPCLTIRGNWLNGFGLDYGSQLKLIESRNMLILVKVPAKKVKKEKKAKEIKKLEQQLRVLKVAERNADYESKSINY